MNIAKTTSMIIVSAVINELLPIIKEATSTRNKSTIEVVDWDNSYNKVNKIIYELNKTEYNKRRTPTTNKEYYDLDTDNTYTIKLKNNNSIKVSVTKFDNKGHFLLKQLRLTFKGKDKVRNREIFLIKSMNLKDEKHINVQYLNNDSAMSCNIIPHSFDNIVLDTKIKDNIINGLNNWNNSKEWYNKHGLVHKIGVFLYGDPGTGKSSVSKGISTMFKNAPIFTIDSSNVMASIGQLLKMRKKYDGVIIVLLEDFDMYFKSRETEEKVEKMESVEKINNKDKKDNNQNAIFQLLDGVYSTQHTIYIATTNHKDRIDPALIRYGRFDIQEELKFFNKEQAIKLFNLFGYGEKELIEMNISYPVQPVILQSKIMKYRATVATEKQQVRSLGE